MQPEIALLEIYLSLGENGDSGRMSSPHIGGRWKWVGSSRHVTSSLISASPPAGSSGQPVNQRHTKHKAFSLQT